MPVFLFESAHATAKLFFYLVQLELLLVHGLSDRSADHPTDRQPTYTVKVSALTSARLLFQARRHLHHGMTKHAHRF
jgi:hypothetical protein